MTWLTCACAWHLNPTPELRHELLGSNQQLRFEARLQRKSPASLHQLVLEGLLSQVSSRGEHPKLETPPEG
jgi:hypothetical protein